MRIETQIEVPNVGEVTIFADLSDFSIENNGIGHYEYFGAKGYDKGTSYLCLETDPNWDEKLFTAEQNKAIWLWICDEAAGDNCPYQKLCDIAEPIWSQDQADRKEAYDLRNV